MKIYLVLDEELDSIAAFTKLKDAEKAAAFYNPKFTIKALNLWEEFFGGTSNAKVST